MSLPAPVYDREGVTVYHADCLDVLPHLEGVDAVVTDPPYGIDLKPRYGGGTRRYPDGTKGEPRKQYAAVAGDDKPFDPEPLLAFPRVLLWGANNYGLSGGQWLVWDKRCGIIPERSQADCEMAWINKPGPARMFRHIWDGMVKDSERGKQRQHPTQKPVELMMWCLDLLKLSANALVLDPYAGSGTTGVACRKSGRRCILVEKDARYIPTIIRRLKECETPLFREAS